MKKYLFIGIALIVIFFSGKLIVDYQKRSSIPKVVVDRYYDIRNSQKDFPAGSLSRCTKEGRLFYLVKMGALGYSGEDYYYDENGAYLGSRQFTDAVVPGKLPSEPPIITKGYQCKSILRWGWMEYFNKNFVLN